MCLLFLNMGTPETILILVAVLLLFGGKKMPELAQGLGKGIREFKTASDNMKRELNEHMTALQEEVDRTEKDIDRALKLSNNSLPKATEDNTDKTKTI